MDIQQERIGFEKKFYHLCEPVVQEAGYRLYDLEYVTAQKILRLFIQDPKTGSAVIEDCIKVDHALTEPFEKETWIPEEIVLEVSSPGVFRNVMNLEHFKMSIGEILAVVITGQLSEEQTAGSPKGLNLKSDKKFRGKLIEANQDEYVIEVKGFNLKLNYKQTKKVNLDPDLKSARE